VNALFDALRAQAVQVAIVFAIVFVLDVLIARRGSVGLRAALWAAFFVKLVLPPGIASPLSIARLMDSAPGTTDLEAQAALLPLSPAAASLLFAWAIGCAVYGAVALRRMRRSRAEWIDGARPAPPPARAVIARLSRRLGMKHAPRLFVRDDAGGAAAVGLWSPVIVVPARMLESRAALEHVLLHELGHVRRHDGLRAAAWTIARCVYWFHPLVHVAARRAALVRELACDEIAAAVARTGAGGYRRTLLDLARPLLGAPHTLTGFAGTGSMITARLERLERATARSRRFDPLPVLMFALLCACCVPLGERAADEMRLPELSDVQGCMRKRFLVMSEMAKQDVQSSHALD
jgi:beta-lactamase regulating signal transducer with metallopeptidase domain